MVGVAYAEAPQDRGMSATIRYTEYGIPHVVARDYTGLGFGEGYAAARDNLCAIANGMVTASGQRSRFFGPDTSPNGADPAGSSLTPATTNLASDLYFASLNDSGVVERLVARPAPLGPSRDVREVVRGYAAGFNRFARQRQPTSCAGAAWLRPMTELDVYRRLYAITLYFGQAKLADAIVSAQPPATAGSVSGAAGPAGTAAAAATPQRAALAIAAANDLTPSDTGGIGSNAIAVGGAATANGRGLMLANPHLPWHGDLRTWQTQLTIPGQLNVSGAALIGTPFVAFGHTETFAWSGTVSTAVPYTLYELKLVPGSPTTYLVDGQPEAMHRREVTVSVRQADGSLTTTTRPQWRTRYGPVVAPRAGGLDVPWTAETAFALADANADNMRLGNLLAGMSRATSTDDALLVLRQTQGNSTFNWLGSDSRGTAVFADLQVVPHVTDEHAATCNTALGRLIFPASGLAVLDGSRTDCAWGNDADALQPGIFGPHRMPVLTRADYVANSNESYWLANPTLPLTGFPRILGDEGTERLPRTRSTFTAAADQLADGPFTVAAMQELMLANRNYAGELVVPGTTRMCQSLPDGTAQNSRGMPVDLRDACAVLSRWDLRNNAGSRGALLFDSYWNTVTARFRPPQWTALWTVAFDPADPVHTPNTLNAANPDVARALADAVTQLASLGIPLDTPYGERHYVVRNGEKIPVTGANGRFGTINNIDPVWDTVAAAYTEVKWGSSFIGVTGFNGSRCPDTRTLLTYSQSADPTSAHYSDQTKLYANNQWVTERFCERDILASPTLSTIRLG